MKCSGPFSQPTLRDNRPNSTVSALIRKGNIHSTVLLTSPRKDVSCLGFYFKWKYFVLIDHLIRNQLSVLFDVLFSNMHPKIKFTAKNWSDLCNFYSKVIFWNFCVEKYFPFLCRIWWLMFHNNIVKISDTWNKRNLLKICFQVTCPTDFCILFYYGKSENIWFILKKKQRLEK